MSASKPEPTLRRLLLDVLLIAVVSTIVEVACRVSAREGLTVVDVARLVAVGSACTTAYLLPVALLGRALKVRREMGLVVGALVGMQCASNYRFEYVLNEFLKDPKVFVGVPAAFVTGFLPVYLADPLLRRIPNWAFDLVALLAAGVAAYRIQPPAHGPVANALPDVVIISMDTTRMDRLGPYGHAIHTPNLDKLAKEGVTFDQAIAEAPITEPSHLAMLTGIAPYTSGIVANGTVLGDRPALIWRALAAKGYATAAFISGFPLHGKYGWGQELDVYDDDFGSIAGMQSLSLVKAWNQVAIKEHALRERSANLTLSRALPWIRAHARSSENDATKAPMFAFVHFYDVHGPYDPHGKLGPAPTTGTPLDLPFYWPAKDRAVTDIDWIEQAYDKEVEYVDDAVGQVVAALGPDVDHTLIIVTADHGESFTEHGYLFDHGDNLYDPSLRVPLFVRYPGHATAGVRVPCQVGGVDLVPTVLDLLGVSDGIKRDGRSLVPMLKDGACDSAPVYSSTVSGRMVADPPVAHSRRLPGEKIIFHSERDPEYFDLTTDPGELSSQSNGASRDALDALVHALQSGGTLVGASQDSQTLQMLKALGYLQDDKAPGPD